VSEQISKKQFCKTSHGEGSGPDNDGSGLVFCLAFYNGQKNKKNPRRPNRWVGVGKAWTRTVNVD